MDIEPTIVDQVRKSQSLNFKLLLRPYRQGGSSTRPAKRTLETITNKLIIGQRFSPDIVGAAVFKTFYEMQFNGLEFPGDGTYGSPGNQLFQHIRNDCIKLSNKETANEVVQKIMDLTACSQLKCELRSRELNIQEEIETAKARVEEVERPHKLLIGLLSLTPFLSTGTYFIGRYQPEILNYINKVINQLWPYIAG